VGRSVIRRRLRWHAPRAKRRCLGDGNSFIKVSTRRTTRGSTQHASRDPRCVFGYRIFRRLNSALQGAYSRSRSPGRIYLFTERQPKKTRNDKSVAQTAFDDLNRKF